MREQNPMRNAATRAKVSRTLKEIGHKPPFRGGNGTGLTECEALVSQATGLSPVAVGIPKWLREAEGTPRNYKIDLGCQEQKVGIEIDGASHNNPTRRSQDRKKERVLSALGWSVLRFTNSRVREDLAGVVQDIRATCTISKSKETTTTS
tara:strand:- start:1337 stop:1786 length:450 start_codon:yes stop_codon:yes gene_type:complete